MSDEALLRERLDERARRLARPPEKAFEGELLEVVTFTFAQELHALETRFVIEVTRLGSLAPVPGAPPVFLGVTSFRGEILPVVDLARVLGTTTRGIGERSRLLVLGEDRVELGILVDRALEMITLPRTATAAPEGSLIRSVEGKGLILLDGERLLASPELRVRPGA